MASFRIRAFRIAIVTVTSAAGLAASTLLTGSAVLAAPAAADVVSVSPTGSISVSMRGSGHGHGVSQYGARGAAIQGLSYRQIVGFYYQGATLSTVASPIIRVGLSGDGSTTTVTAYSDLAASGVGLLPYSGVSRYRFVASGSGISLQQLRSASGSTWTNYRTGLPNRAEFHRTHWYSMQQFRSDGSSTYYLGFLRAVRTSSGVYTVNRVRIDQYTAGVVPREMPVSWPAQAVDAQAVAARTYGMNAVESTGGGGEYDICDTNQCQVYGGHYHSSSTGELLWSDYAPAVRATADQVLRYRGATIFAQFATSNGGWSADGGQPYLVAKRDPYDNLASGDPYLLYKTTVRVATVARYYGLAKLTRIVVSTRDRHGAWGGRMIAGYVQGTDSAGRGKTVNTTGAGLQSALGIGTTWFLLAAA